jgi:hypothetical protein
MATVPSVYVILGTPGSGRREIVRDLVENGLEAADKVQVLLADSEAADPADALLAGRAATTVTRWTGAPDLPDADLVPGATVFLLADPRGDAVSQIEALKPWLAERGAELARVLAVVDCQFAEKHPALLAWYEACIHFADVVLLTHREGVANKWVSDFMRHFADQFFPCLFLQVKKAGLANPALVLEPQSRRVSQYFEEDYVDLSDIVIETGDDEAEEGEAVQPGEDDGIIPPEPYFVRLRSGRRAKEVPDPRPHFAAK